MKAHSTTPTIASTRPPSRRDTRGLHSFILLRVLSAICCLALVATLAACATSEEATAARADAIATRDRLVAGISALSEAVAELPDSDPAKTAALARLESSRTTRDALDAAILEVDAALAHDPDTSLLEPLADAVPGPWRAPLLLGGAGIALFLRGRQLRQGVTSIVRGIEVAKREDAEFRRLFEQHANTFRALQSPLARKIVDEVIGAGPRPPLPAPAVPAPAPLPPGVTRADKAAPDLNKGPGKGRTSAKRI